jgi:hypothetical protein
MEGIQIQKDRKGTARYARIDLSKYGERLMPFFNEVGFSPYNPEFVQKIKESKAEIETGDYEVVDVDNLWK